MSKQPTPYYASCVFPHTRHANELPIISAFEWDYEDDSPVKSLYCLEPVMKCIAKRTKNYSADFLHDVVTASSRIETMESCNATGLVNVFGVRTNGADAPAFIEARIKASDCYGLPSEAYHGIFALTLEVNEYDERELVLYRADLDSFKPGSVSEN